MIVHFPHFDGYLGVSYAFEMGERGLDKFDGDLGEPTVSIFSMD